MFLLLQIWHGMCSIFLIYIVSMDQFMMSWYILPMFIEILNFFRSHNLVYILINGYIQFEPENSSQFQHIKMYFAKIYLISIFWLVFFFFKMNVCIFLIRDFLVWFNIPILLTQIIHNSFKERRNRINPFIIVFTPLRLFVPLYFNLCPGNFLHLIIKPLESYILVLLISLEIVAMSLQYNFSTKQIFPCFSTQTFNYHYCKKDSYFAKSNIKVKEVTCSICLNELEPSTSIELVEENSLNINNKGNCIHNNVDNENNSSPQNSLNSNEDHIQETDESQVLQYRSIKVKIYMAYKKLVAINKFILKMPLKIVKYILISLGSMCKNYLCCCYFKTQPKDVNTKIMVTPCNHVFHSECLVNWMDHKEVCPICRTALPDIE